jgi:uncharacterized protein
LKDKNMTTEKKPQNFASLPKDKMREIASKGGKTAHSKGTARKWTKEEAIKFAELGGIASREKYLKMKEEKQKELSK